jgi:hypothetical protein
LRRGAFSILVVCWLLASIGTSAQEQPASSTAAQKAAHSKKSPPPKPFVLVGAGDIASCESLDGAEATAKLIEGIPGEVVAAGDLAYEHGTAEEFKNCYGKTWGRFKNRTHPAPGNHEFYGSKGASPYFDYWGAQAGERDKGYYSFDLGGWHIIALNTNCAAPGLGGCAAGSPQDSWLQKDLAEHAKSCIVAFGHHALYSSGVLRSHAVHPELRRLWQDLYRAHADLMLNGHEHSYERFAPQDPYGNLDEKRGIREFVVGTGGRDHGPLGFPISNSQVRDAGTFGVLKLTLSPGKYAWEFVPVEGSTFRDSGEGVCHNEKPPR